MFDVDAALQHFPEATVSFNQLNVPAGRGPGTATNIENQDFSKTLIWEGGGPNDNTRVEVSDDGFNWVSVLSVTGANWAQGFSAKVSWVRVNRVAVDAASAANCYEGALDINPAAAQAPTGVNSFGPFAISGGGNVNTPSNAPTPIASYQTTEDGSYQVEINLAYRNTTSSVSGSRKVTGTINRTSGILTVTAQQNVNIGDNAAFGSNITTVLTVSGTEIQLTVTGLSATSIDWSAEGTINFAS